MAALTPEMSIPQYQQFIREVYGMPNDRHFELGEMASNIQRFAMRGLKGIRKADAAKTKQNLLISMSWFTSSLNRLHVDLEEEVWERFPYLCSYCGSRPCSCKARNVEERLSVPVVQSLKPKALAGFQKMFSEIYPPSTRSLEHAGVHLAEEVGEFSEALHGYRSERTEEDFKNVRVEAADYFSCVVGVFNSLGADMAEELCRMFPSNCHECGYAPCRCSYAHIKDYKS